MGAEERWKFLRWIHAGDAGEKKTAAGLSVHCKNVRVILTLSGLAQLHPTISTL